MQIFIQTLAAMLAVCGFCFVLEVPRKLLLYTSAIGGTGWLVYLCLSAYGYGSVLSSFWAAVLIALLSHMSARRLKSPVTVFLIGGILPLVPGAGMYRTAYSLIREDSGQVFANLQETLLIAGGIAVAIFIMDTVFRLMKRR